MWCALLSTGHVTGLCQIESVGAMAASDDQGTIAVFSTTDATRLAYKARASPDMVSAITSHAHMVRFPGFILPCKCELTCLKPRSPAHQQRALHVDACS